MIAISSKLLLPFALVLALGGCADVYGSRMVDGSGMYGSPGVMMSDGSRRHHRAHACHYSPRLERRVCHHR